MYGVRYRFLIASAAMAGLAIPSALLAGNNIPNHAPDEQQTTLNSRDNQQSRPDEQALDQQVVNQSQENQQNAQDKPQDNSQDQQNQESQSIKGQVQSYRDVTIDGTQHFRARLKTPDGSMKTVDFGPSARSSDLIDNIEQGDHVSVQGYALTVDGKPIFMADQARLDGQTYRIAQANGQSHADEGQNRQVENQRQVENKASEENCAKAEGTEANGQQSKQQPKEVVLLNERFVFVDEGDLNRHLILAKEALRMGDRHAAAGELMVAAERLGLYTNGQGSKQASDDLNTARQDLHHLAADINKKNSNVKPQEIDQAAARAQSAMAMVFDERVQSEKGTDRAIEAGYDLQSAATHAREALLWSDQNVPNDAAHSIRQALSTADSMITGQDQSTKQADQVEQTLSTVIDHIDQQGDQNQAQPAAEQMPGKEQEKSNQNQKQRQQPQTNDDSQNSTESHSG